MTGTIKKPATELKWVLCPYCGAKTVLASDTAQCSGVQIKCTRGCKKVFELVIRDGKQVK